jgi:hypothetical protein
MRVHCFYYLLPLFRNASHVPTASQAQEADARVHQLTQDLIKWHSLLGRNCQRAKVRYVFEGLGNLVAAIFIQGAHARRSRHTRTQVRTTFRRSTTMARSACTVIYTACNRRYAR